MNGIIDQDATFYISVDNGEEVIHSNDISASAYEFIKNRVMKCLENKLPYDFVDDEMNTIILPYKVLKRAKIELIWNEKE